MIDTPTNTVVDTVQVVALLPEGVATTLPRNAVGSSCR
jgi:hypothetical protein